MAKGKIITKRTARKSTGGKAPRTELPTRRPWKGVQLREAETKDGASSSLSSSPSPMLLGIRLVSFDTEDDENTSEDEDDTVDRVVDVSVVASHEGFQVSSQTALKSEFPEPIKHIFEAAAKQTSDRYLVIWQDVAGKISLRGHEPRVTNHRFLLAALKDAKTNCRCRIVSEGRGDDGYAYALEAAVDMDTSAVVGVETGVATTEEEFKERMGDSLLGLHSTHVESKLWKGVDSLKHHKIPEMRIDCTAHGNQFRVVNDPLWAAQDYYVPSMCNMGAFLVFDTERAMPNLAYFTTRAVKKGEQLFVDWGPDAWMPMMERYLTNQAETSLWYWRWLNILKSASHGLDGLDETRIEARVKKLRSSVLYFDPCSRGYCGVNDYLPAGENPRDGVKYAGDLPPAHDEKRIKMYEHMTEEEGLEVVDAKDVYTSMGLSLENENQYNVEQLEPDVLDKLKHVNTKKLELRGWHMVENEPEVLAILRGYDEDDRTHVVEVQYVPHPCRYFTPPDSKAYGLIAARELEMGDVVEVYAGNLWAGETLANASERGDVDPHTDHYAYDIDLTGLIAAGYDGPSLLVENKAIPCKARFANCRFMREGGEKDVNCHAELWWDDERKLPVVVFAASRRIPKDEEIVVDYGGDYWRIVWKHLVRAHAEFWVRTYARCEELERVINENKLDLPPMPDAKFDKYFPNLAKA